MKGIALLSFLVLWVGLSACGVFRNSSSAVQKESFEVIHQDILTGGGSEGIEESLVVCNTQAELDALAARMNSVNPTTEFLDAASVDFSKETVIAYFQPVRSSGGYSLKVNSVTSQPVEGVRLFFIEYLVEVSDGSVTMMLTQPYIFIKTRKTKRTVKHSVIEKKAL